MKGRRFGYIRATRSSPETDRDREQLKVDLVFTDETSGKVMDRPHLQALLQSTRPGDTIVVNSIDRLGFGLEELCRTLSRQIRRGVSIEFLKEGLLFSGVDSPKQNILLSVIEAFAACELALADERKLETIAHGLERRREGIALAKQRGSFMGRTKFLTLEKAAELCRRSGNGENKAALAREFGISRETLYHYLRDAADVRDI